MTGALTGIRVIEFWQVYLPPHIVANYWLTRGADVIKVEPPDRR